MHINVEITAVYTKECPIKVPMAGTGQMSRSNARCLPLCTFMSETQNHVMSFVQYPPVSLSPVLPRTWNTMMSSGNNWQPIGSTGVRSPTSVKCLLTRAPVA